MIATLKEPAYEAMLDEAKKGDVIVADVFAAIRSGKLSEDQAKQILLTFEKADNMWLKIVRQMLAHR